MKLRELINRLEELSEDGKNDDMEVYTDEDLPIENACVINYSYVELETDPI